VRARHAQAADLAARHPAPPETLAARDEHADEVAAALDGWVARPKPIDLAGPSAAELAAELAALPPEPAGDRAVHPSVAEARRALDMADAALAALADQPEEPPSDLPAVDEARVRELARRLRTPQLPGAAGLEQELEVAQAAARTASTRVPMVVAGIAVAAAAVGVVLLLVGMGLPGAALLVLAAIGAGVAWTSGTGSRRASARVARSEAALAPYRSAREAADHDRTTAANEARQAGLPANAGELDEIADRLAAASVARRLVDERAARVASLTARRGAAEGALASALAARGAVSDGDPRVAMTEYEAACRERAEQAASAGRADLLRSEIAARESAERSAQAAEEAVQASEERLRSAAALVGVAAAGIPDEVVAAMRAWQRQRSEQLRENEVAIGEWQRLQMLLDGRSLDEMLAAADEADRDARELAARLGEPITASGGSPADIEGRLAAARERAMTVSSLADSLRGNLGARRETLPDVAEAEEAAASARTELQRVEALAATLDATLTLLRSAEERVHRSLAPKLASTIARWLPSVSGGAYEDVSVDPAELVVRVKEASSGQWRDAHLLSEGTREQIYLLLRVAMAEHLVTNGEIAPLLLDEVTVQSDSGRKRELLAMLHALSAERQVVLFTHDDEVLAWADQSLDAGRDATVRLALRATRPVAAVPVEVASDELARVEAQNTAG
jgi:exonuclease SbcC